MIRFAIEKGKKKYVEEDRVAVLTARKKLCGW
jgi:hypothetical protein